MRGVRTPLLLVAALLGLGGCSAFFDANLYAALGPTPAPKASDYQGSEGLSRLATDLDSPAIVEALAKDPKTTSAIQSYLLDTYHIFSEPLHGVDSQQAAVLYSELCLATTGGDEVVNNAVLTLQAGIEPGQSIKDVLEAIVPADVLADSSRFSSMMTGMIAASDAYLAFGDSIGATGDGTLQVPPGVEMGDVAQKALTAYVAAFVVSEVATVIGGTPDEAIQQIHRALMGEPSTVPAGYTVGDPYGSPPAALANIVQQGLTPELRPF